MGKDGMASEIAHGVSYHVRMDKTLASHQWIMCQGNKYGTARVFRNPRYPRNPRTYPTNSSLPYSNLRLAHL